MSKSRTTKTQTRPIMLRLREARKKHHEKMNKASTRLFQFTRKHFRNAFLEFLSQVHKKAYGY